MVNMVAVYEAWCSGYRVTLNCYIFNGQYCIQVITKVKRLSVNWWSQFEKEYRHDDKKSANQRFWKIVKEKSEVADDKRFRFRRVK